MAKDNTTLLLLGGGALVAWYGYQQGWFASFGFAPAAAAVPVTPTPALPASAPQSPAPTSGVVAATSAASTPTSTPASTPSGPSLASMLTALQAQLAQNTGDPALSNSGGTVSAICDVFNYYLVAAGVGVSDGMLQCSDHSTVMTVAQYWAWAAPQLQAKIPGLSGLGNVYAGLGELVRLTKRGW